MVHDPVYPATRLLAAILVDERHFICGRCTARTGPLPFRCELVEGSM